MCKFHFITCVIWILLTAGLPSVCSQSDKAESKAPFIDTGVIHPTHSEFEFNLILNENRQFPVIYAQYSKDKTKKLIQGIVEDALKREPDACFALFVDCRKFHHDMNQTIGLCRGFDKEAAKIEEEEDKKKPIDEVQDVHFRLEFLSPNPSKIRQKGHVLSKNHETQNLRQSGYEFNGEFMAKIIRNELPDFVWYIEDSFDMEEFLESRSEFRSSKQAKLLLFDQNLQAPLFLKKLAMLLDGKMKVGVTDNFKLAKKHEAFTDVILLMEYNFQAEKYDTKRIEFEEGTEIKSILSHEWIHRYLKLKKFRDIVLDFQHKDSTVNHMSSVQEINQLITQGRIIFLEVSEDPHSYECPAIREISKKHSVFFNYVCFSLKNAPGLSSVGLEFSRQQSESSRSVHIIDKDYSSALRVPYDFESFSVYDYLPRVSSRQKISASSQAQLCIKTALSSKRDPLFYWYEDRDHKDTIALLEYFNSLQEVTSLIHFCQIFLPDEETIQQYSLVRNSLFSMRRSDRRPGEMQKFEFKEALDFNSVKMFLREIAVGQMLKVYEEKLATSQLKEITSAEKLTEQCFKEKCIIALMATNRFRYESELQLLQEVKLKMSDLGYNFVWIDGICHWDVARQLRFLGKKEKEIDRSYIFYYQEKTNNYSLMKSVETNKYWVEKDVKKWVKSLELDQSQVKRMKFGIDIQEKKCETPKGRGQSRQRKTAKGAELNDDEL